MAGQGWAGLGWREVLFSAKTFTAAMLALYIALAMDLPRPYWAVSTAYVVAQPFAGAVRNRATWRLLGTIVAACFVVATLPALVDAPLLLCAVFAAWIAFCLGAALLDRTPRGYGFMLSGYTVAFLGFPSVTAPETIFDVAVARVEEIALAVLCVLVVDSVVLPRSAGRALTVGIERWLASVSA
ncbi:MAG TPA: FUSC family protein, partial [Acetobacteraceae bacterium]